MYRKEGNFIADQARRINARAAPARERKKGVNPYLSGACRGRLDTRYDKRNRRCALGNNDEEFFLKGLKRPHKTDNKQNINLHIKHTRDMTMHLPSTTMQNEF